MADFHYNLPSDTNIDNQPGFTPDADSNPSEAADATPTTPSESAAALHKDALARAARQAYDVDNQSSAQSQRRPFDRAKFGFAPAADRQTERQAFGGQNQGAVNYQAYLEQGGQALRVGNLPLAKQAFSQAIVESDKTYNQREAILNGDGNPNHPGLNQINKLLQDSTMSPQERAFLEGKAKVLQDLYLSPGVTRANLAFMLLRNGTTQAELLQGYKLLKDAIEMVPELRQNKYFIGHLNYEIGLNREKFYGQAYTQNILNQRNAVFNQAMSILHQLPQEKQNQVKQLEQQRQQIQAELAQSQNSAQAQIKLNDNTRKIDTMARGYLNLLNTADSLMFNAHLVLGQYQALQEIHSHCAPLQQQGQHQIVDGRRTSEITGATTDNMSDEQQLTGEAHALPQALDNIAQSKELFEQAKKATSNEEAKSLYQQTIDECAKVNPELISMFLQQSILAMSEKKKILEDKSTNQTDKEHAKEAMQRNAVVFGMCQEFLAMQVEARLGLAVALNNLGRQDEAKPLLKEITDASPELANVPLVKRIAAGEAIDLIEFAKSLDEHKEVKGEGAQDDNQPPEYAVLLNKAIEDFKAGKYEDAHEALQAGIKKVDEAWTADKQKELCEQLKEVESELRKLPAKSTLAALRGQLDDEQKATEEKRQQLEAMQKGLTALIHEKSEYRIHAAILYNQMHKPDLAKKCLDELEVEEKTIQKFGVLSNYLGKTKYKLLKEFTEENAKSGLEKAMDFLKKESNDLLSDFTSGGFGVLAWNMASKGGRVKQVAAAAVVSAGTKLLMDQAIGMNPDRNWKASLAWGPVNAALFISGGELHERLASRLGNKLAQSERGEFIKALHGLGIKEPEITRVFNEQNKQSLTALCQYLDHTAPGGISALADKGVLTQLGLDEGQIQAIRSSKTSYSKALAKELSDKNFKDITEELVKHVSISSSQLAKLQSKGMSSALNAFEELAARGVATKQARVQNISEVLKELKKAQAVGRSLTIKEITDPLEKTGIENVCFRVGAGGRSVDASKVLSNAVALLREELPKAKDDVAKAVGSMRIGPLHPQYLNPHTIFEGHNPFAFKNLNDVASLSNFEARLYWNNRKLDLYSILPVAALYRGLHHEEHVLNGDINPITNKPFTNDLDNWLKVGQDAVTDAGVGTFIVMPIARPFAAFNPGSVEAKAVDFLPWAERRGVWQRAAFAPDKVGYYADKIGAKTLGVVQGSVDGVNNFFSRSQSLAAPQLYSSAARSGMLFSSPLFSTIKQGNNIEAYEDMIRRNQEPLHNLDPLEMEDRDSGTLYNFYDDITWDPSRMYNQNLDALMHNLQYLEQQQLMQQQEQ